LKRRTQMDDSSFEGRNEKEKGGGREVQSKV
jgi:hypothetical protein